MSTPIRILIADDHPVWRRGIRALLDAEPDMTVVAEASDGVEALDLICTAALDVAILDMEMPGLTGIEVARTAQERACTTRLLALSSYDDDVYVSGLLSNGASGYITKDKPPALILEAVRAVARGEGRWFVQPNVRGDPASVLSDREREVVVRLAQGMPNSQIAGELFISENTVRNHLARSYGKLGVTSAREASAWAWRNGVVGDP